MCDVVAYLRSNDSLAIPFKFNFEGGHEPALEHESAALNEGGDSLTERKIMDEKYEGGSPIRKTGYQPGSCFGGFLTVIYRIIMLYILVGSFRDIYETRKSDMVHKLDVFDEEKRPPEVVDMAEFEASLNFFFGIAVWDEATYGTWDPLNNPYVDFKAHQLENGLKLQSIHEL